MDEEKKMTTEKTKAALLDALETIKHYSKCSERGQEAIQSEFDLAVETIAAYITTMPHSYDDSYTTNATSGTVAVPQEVVDEVYHALRSARIELATYNGNKPTPYLDKALTAFEKHKGG